METIRKQQMFFGLMLCLLAPTASFAQTPPPCSSDSAFTWLDFWLGDWTVTVDGKQVGTNHIEKILDGCAVTEDWVAADSTHGHSLFYFEPGTRTWKQVWVTQRALGRGGVKEKALIARLSDSSLCFQGTIPLSDSTSYLDRTTLTSLGPDSVHQLIEISTDNGTTWHTTFDAIYIRSK